MPSVRIIGMGRAGRSFHRALREVGWSVEGLARTAAPADAAQGVDLLLLCTPDAAIADVASAVEPGGAVVAHVAGSMGLEALGSHDRVAAIHPLMSLPNAVIGAARLLDRGWFAVAGDALAGEVVAALGGTSFTVADADRAVYHAAACVASNHVVALMGQVERLASSVGVPAAAYAALATDSLANAIAIGAADALTGPAARGDLDTIARHLAALPDDERATYEAMVREARRLAASLEARPPGED
jgi:predicted short-subunit dehydrogenase-like oxidoreductase (DUF2520 family)